MIRPMIRMGQKLVAEISAAAEGTHPEECCGLLVGRREAADVLVTRLQPSPNVADGDRRKSFLVDAKIQFDLMRELGDGPDEIVGNYHSHPGAPAKPSDHDRQSVYYPDHVWVIVAVEDGRAGDVAAWVFDRDDDNFRQVGLDVPLAEPGGA